MHIQRSILLIVLGVLFLGSGLALRAHSEFEEGAIVVIEEGDTIRKASEKLYDAKVIRSPSLFRALIKYRYQGSLIAGPYEFSDSGDLLTVAKKVSSGNYGLEPVRITFPEGLTHEQVASLLSDSLPLFNEEVFLSLANDYPGQLFPETYYFFPIASEDEIVRKMHATFVEKTEEFKELAESQGKEWDEVLAMAAIVEKEASDEESRRMIADVLWRRLQEGMALQVDAPFLALFGKTSADLTLDDLKVESPFNTYLYPGLPPEAFVNPGTESIYATLNPIKNPYVFYLADSTGKTYYSETFEEHVDKKRRYLN